MIQKLITDQRKFTLNALKSGQRLDNRQKLENRRISVDFLDLGTLIVKYQSSLDENSLGTRIQASVQCKAIQPLQERPSEGQIHVSINFNGHSISREQEVLLNRMIEKIVKTSRCLDMESLCILSGNLVWDINLSLAILENDGNLESVMSFAAISALMHFRHPDVKVSGTDVTIGETNIVPLSLHHVPICLKVCYFDNGEKIVDPNLDEESLATSSVIIVLNTQRELCLLQKIGGTTVSMDDIYQLIDPQQGGIAPNLTDKLCKILKDIVTSDLILRDVKMSSLKGN